MLNKLKALFSKPAPVKVSAPAPAQQPAKPVAKAPAAKKPAAKKATATKTPAKKAAPKKK